MKKLYDALIENGIFREEYLEDKDMNVDDIKIGHTYFWEEKMLKEKKTRRQNVGT